MRCYLTRQLQKLKGLSPTGQRRAFGFGVVAVGVVLGYYYLFSDGLPIIFGPTARASEIAAGRELFEHEWLPNDPLAHGDGLGPVFNARSCASCHFQGGLGGGGGREHNANSFEVFPRPGDPNFITGTIHNFSVDQAQQESTKQLRAMYPVIRGRTIPPNPGSCSGPTVIPDFDPVHTQTVQATALFGAGWVDLISDRAILRNARNRGMREAVNELRGEFAQVPVGRVRHVRGGVGKFGWKSQFATLEEFVAAACANELGLGTPSTEQARPLTAPGQSGGPDLDRKQFRSLVAFVKTLPKPVETGEAPHGKELFSSIGCAICHVPNMGGVKGVYSDFLLYSLEDPFPKGGGGGGDYREPPPQLQLPARPEEDPKPSEWKTPPLWGVADSAPYMHDGSAATLRDAILAHRGDAKNVTKKFLALNSFDQAALLSFLGTLRAPPDALPLSNPNVTRLARK
jgi:CxxC motif-containing protein (DUF1111 family)